MVQKQEFFLTLFPADISGEHGLGASLRSLPEIAAGSGFGVKPQLAELLSSLRQDLHTRRFS
jgi:hypothetical protein